MPDLQLLSRQWAEHGPAVWKEVLASFKSGGFDADRIALAISMNLHLPREQTKEMLITAEVKLDTLHTRVNDLLDTAEDHELVSKLSDELQIPMAIVDYYIRAARQR